MERSGEYEPIIVDLQKSQPVRQSRHYLALLVSALVVFVGTFVTFAAFYYPKLTVTPTPRMIATPTPAPEPTPTAPPVKPTPAPVVKPPAPTPTPQPVEVAGWLTLYSTPDNADVAIDGKVIGQTPLTNYQLTPGSYTVKFAYNGQVSQQQLTIMAGKTTEYTHRFEGLGSLRILTTSSGSEILINGKLAGQSPLLVEGLAPGTYTIVASKVGYTTAERTVTLGQGEHQELLLTVRRLGLFSPAAPNPTPTPRPVHPSERLNP